jgi:hypothetical protein
MTKTNGHDGKSSEGWHVNPRWQRWRQYYLDIGSDADMASMMADCHMQRWPDREPPPRLRRRL